MELTILKRTFIQKDRKSWGLEYKLLGQTYAEHQKKLRRESEVGMAIRYWFRWNFPPSYRPDLGPTHSPVQWELHLFPGGKTAGRGVEIYKMP